MTAGDPMSDTGPYAAAGHLYLRLGWRGPLPIGWSGQDRAWLPARKASPQTGWTGYAAPYPSGADVQEWIDDTDGRGAVNIGLRLPQTVIGIDVDHYGGKDGAMTFLNACTRLGPPPQTPRSSARPDDPVSGIRFYRGPAEHCWADTLGPGVEIIHWGHRYAIVSPSIHPDTGQPYRWYDPDGNVLSEPPAVTDLPELPVAWVSELDRGDVTRRSTRVEVTDADVSTFVATLPAGDPCRYLRRLLDQARVDLGRAISRHDVTRNYVLAAVRAGEQGHLGSEVALGELRAMFTEALAQGEPRQPDPGEWARMLLGAIAYVTARPTSLFDLGCCGDGDTTAAAVAEHAEILAAGAVVEEEDTGEPPAPGESWRSVDLTETVAGVLAGTVKRRAPTIGMIPGGLGLFYPGKVNGVAGASGSAKTWTALLAAREQIRAGEHVVYVDLEDDAQGFVERLLDIGLEPQLILERFHYVHPHESYGVDAAGVFTAEILAHRPALVVIDSTGESMALDGAKPNDDDDVARWFRKLPTAVALHGPAVVVLDHVTKADDSGLWPIGSQRKRAAVSGAQYMQTAAEPFTKVTEGSARLVCAKDRYGNYRKGEHVANLTGTPTAAGFELGLHPVGRAASGDDSRPLMLMEKISTVLTEAGESLGFRKVRERVSAREEAVRSALGVLVEEGYVERVKGANNAKLHRLVRPFWVADELADDAQCLRVSRCLPVSPGDSGGSVSVSPIPVGVGDARTGIGSQSVSPEEVGPSELDPQVDAQPVDNGGDVLIACERCRRPVMRSILAATDGICGECLGRVETAVETEERA